MTITETTNESDVKLREAFETWAVSEGYKVSTVRNPLLNRDDYNHVATGILWTGYQAATRASDHLLEMAVVDKKAKAANIRADDLQKQLAQMTIRFQDAQHKITTTYLPLLEMAAEALRFYAKSKQNSWNDFHTMIADINEDGTHKLASETLLTLQQHLGKE